jgi:5-formyltetrahydrofolate cyclo-ligase
MRNWSCRLPNNVHDPVTKNQLRKSLRAERRAIDLADRHLAALSSRDRLAESALFQAAIHIGCYLAQGSEFDLQPIIELIWASQKQCYLPVLADSAEKTLHFVAYAAGDPLQVNHHAIREPVFSAAKERQPSALDLVLVPLIGFDREGHRLGSGSGYYDRTFAFLQSPARPKQPCFVGVGFQVQEREVIPYDAWDVRMDGVLTEQALILCL